MWFILFTIVCLLALYVLWLKPADQLPPLIPVLAVAILYIDCLYVVLWTIQIYEPSDVMDAYLLIPGAAFVLVVARTIAITVQAHSVDVERSIKLENNALLAWLNRYVARAKTWPVAAFTVALPLLGLAYAAPVLLGQGPHALIRAFSDTSDWTLSQQTSPPNV